ncbi:hypothetical protein O3P69_011534 [Scylla paramamosain]|uniref:Uncharacterized protein n=1 Tax=Scylla paramamosain TaxID=85552 RepID=A0AAW0T743_SCYPA
MKLLPLGEEGSEDHQHQHGHEHTAAHPAGEEAASGGGGWGEAAGTVWEGVAGGGKGKASLSLVVKACSSPPRHTCGRMRSSVFVAVLVLVVLAALLTQGQELHVPEREGAVATLAARILKVVHGPQEAAAGLPHKRNSELINSLLGLSPLMNEAGRR